MQTAIRQGGGVAITRLDAPQAGPDEVLVEVRCTGIAPEEWGWGALGGTVVGRVVGKGANVRDRREGDWLVGLRGPDLPCGGLGTLSLLESHLCAPCAEMTKDQYVLLPFLGLIASAHLLISQELRTTPGDTIFISACPEQAIYAQVASILGLKVFVTKAIPLPTPVPANVTVLQADPENAVQVAAGLLQETSGLGVDCAFLTADILELAKCVSVRGTVVIPCYCKQTISSSLTLSLDKLLSAKSSAVRYHSLYSWLAAPTKEGVFAHVLLEAMRFIASGSIQPPYVTQMSLKHAVEVINTQPPRHLSVGVGERT